MTIADDLLAISTVPDRAPQRGSHPKGYEPGVRWDADKGAGQIRTGPLPDAPDEALWAEIVADWGLDPNVVTVDMKRVEVRGWDAPVGNGEIKRLRYYRAGLIATSSAPGRDDGDVVALCRAAAKLRPVKAPVVDGERALAVVLSDWQAGKGEGGGTEATVERVVNALGALKRRLAELAKVGRPVSRLYLCGVGDLVEQCSGNYPSQAFTVDLNRRQQMRVARRLILRHVDELLGSVPEIVLVAVAGNHGENRNGDGLAFTTPDDNDDLAVFEQVAEILAANPDRYGSVSVMLADQLAVTVDMCGVIVGLTHMHQASRGSTPQAKVEEWWRGQALGRNEQGIGDADLLITAHYHHLQVSESTGRTWMQAPAQDGGSRWFRDRTGQSSPSGLLTVGVGAVYLAETGRPWGDLAVLQ